MELHNNKIRREIAKKLIAQGITNSDSMVKEILANKDKFIVKDPTGKWTK